MCTHRADQEEKEHEEEHGPVCQQAGGARTCL